MGFRNKVKEKFSWLSPLQRGFLFFLLVVFLAVNVVNLFIVIVKFQNAHDNPVQSVKYVELEEFPRFALGVCRPVQNSASDYTLDSLTNQLTTSTLNSDNRLEELVRTLEGARIMNVLVDMVQCAIFSLPDDVTFVNDYSTTYTWDLKLSTEACYNYQINTTSLLYSNYSECTAYQVILVVPEGQLEDGLQDYEALILGQNSDFVSVTSAPPNAIVELMMQYRVTETLKTKPTINFSLDPVLREPWSPYAKPFNFHLRISSKSLNFIKIHTTEEIPFDLHDAYSSVSSIVCICLTLFGFFVSFEPSVPIHFRYTLRREAIASNMNQLLGHAKTIVSSGSKSSLFSSNPRLLARTPSHPISNSSSSSSISQRDGRLSVDEENSEPPTAPLPAYMGTS